MTGCSQPTIVTRAGSRSTSSWASRRAAAAGSSPSLRRPPGKLTSPLWVRKPDERRVRISRASPSSSKSAARTPALTLARVAGRPRTR